MNYTETLRFRQELELGRIADAVAALEIVPEESEIAIETLANGEPGLRIEVPYSFGSSALFTVSEGETDEEGGRPLMLEAYFSSSAENGALQNRTELEGVRAERLADEFVRPFLWAAFGLEHEDRIRLVPVSMANVESYLSWLPDAFPERDGCCVVGIDVNEETGWEPCGAAVCGAVEDPESGESCLVIDRIEVDPFYRGMGIATYVLNVLKENFEG